MIMKKRVIVKKSGEGGIYKTREKEKQKQDKSIYCF